MAEEYRGKHFKEEHPASTAEKPLAGDTAEFLRIVEGLSPAVGHGSGVPFDTADPGETAAFMRIAATLDTPVAAEPRSHYAPRELRNVAEEPIALAPAPGTTSGHRAAQAAETATPAEPPSRGVDEAVGRSAMVISLCVMVSRITGFIRTWAMGFAMGTTLLSSSYQVACNLPNQLYELVMGGMLVTAFLPVYVSLRKREGVERANSYASTLMGIVLVFLGLIALAATVFAPQVVWTQMFLNTSGDRDLVTYFFRFFAVQLLFYGVSAVAGGLLNAQRDYFWSSAAPIANNIVVIAVMFVYVFIAPGNPELGKLFIAVGTPLGVFVQMAMQLPALAKNRIHLRPWRVDLHDPALRETLALGVPTIVVTVASFVTVSVQNAAAMAVSDAGSSVLFYARQWFTLPYAFLSVPLTTTLFTELSSMVADENREGVRRGIVTGTQQNLFFMVPFAFYLAVFSMPLVSLFQAGNFSEDSVALVANYLAYMAISLPFYALFLFMQKTFSALRRMKAYAVCNLVVSAVQVLLTLLLCLGVGGWHGLGLPGIALAQTAFFALGTLWCYAYLKHELGSIELRSLMASLAWSLGLGLAGAAAGGAVLWVLCTFVGPLGHSIPQALLYVVVGGCVALAVTYGVGVACKAPGSAFVGRLVNRIVRR